MNKHCYIFRISIFVCTVDKKYLICSCYHCSLTLPLHLLVIPLFFPSSEINICDIMSDLKMEFCTYFLQIIEHSVYIQTKRKEITLIETFHNKLYISSAP